MYFFLMQCQFIEYEKPHIICYIKSYAFTTIVHEGNKVPRVVAKLTNLHYNDVKLLNILTCTKKYIDVKRDINDDTPIEQALK